MMEKTRTYKKFRFSLVLACVTVFLTFCTPSAMPINTDSEGVAIKGYDPVAYFTTGKPVKGDKEFEYKWKGAKWRFSSKEHLRLFMDAPEKYAPQYGGYWAYAVSRGTTADIDPDSWSIVDGKLYLNLNKKIQKLWKNDVPGNIKKADENWPGVIKK